MNSYVISRTSTLRLFLICLPLWGALLACSFTSSLVSKSTPVDPPIEDIPAIIINTPTLKPKATEISQPKHYDLSEDDLDNLAQEGLFVSSRYGFTLTLPISETASANWQLIDKSKIASPSIDLQFEEQPNDTQSLLLAQLQSMSIAETTELTAFFLEQNSDDLQTVIPHFNLVVMPRNGLSLSRYVEGITNNLNQVAGVQQIQAGIDYEWRPDGIPTASIRYEVGHPLIGADKRIMTGHQVAFFDRTGENIMLGTFVISNEFYDEMLPTFKTIITNIRFPIN